MTKTSTEHQAYMAQWVKELRERKEKARPTVPTEEDILYLEKLKTPRGGIRRPSIRPHSKNPGIVYMIAPEGWEDMMSVPVKIGMTNNAIEQRLHSLQGANWQKLVVIDVSPTIVGAYKLERKLHKIYTKQNIHREWYTLTHSDIEQIKLEWQK